MTRTPELARGETVGRYQVIRTIGRGGMGTVYAAHDPKLDRQIALKLLHATHGYEAAERMIREAQALARLDDPHVVQVFDAGEHDGQVYIAMQLVDGDDLAATLYRKRHSVPQIISWFCAAGQGLAAAHEAKLVHRDFKPSNVLVDRRGRVAVTDFGLVQYAEPSVDTSLTRMGTLLGTPAYMSPEQHAQQLATAASDQFSFCVALWEALLGQHPFIEGDHSVIASMSPFAIGYQIYDGALLPPPKGRGVPRRVIEALTRGLSRDPLKRWPAMAPLLAELAPAQKRRVWPIAVATALVAGGGAAAVVYAVQRQPAAPPSCAEQTAERVNAAWSTTHAQQLHERFAQSGRSYAESAATQTRTGLDRYATRWQQLAADVCAAEQAAGGPTPDLIVRRRACLDGRLDALRGVGAMLTQDSRPELVDKGHVIVDGLPELGDCVDDSSLPGTPPAAIASQVAALTTELNAIDVLGNSGDFRAARDRARAALDTATKLGWGPAQSRAYFAIGRASLGLLEPAREDLVRSAELATIHHLDRDASRAWTLAQQAAGHEQASEALATLKSIARAAAERTGDRDLIASAAIRHARALLRLRKWKDGGEACKAAYDLARTVDRRAVLDDARDCMIEALVPLGAGTELETLIEQVLVDKAKALGTEHPTISDYLRIRASIHLTKGRVAEARKDVDQMLAIRRRVYPAKHYKIAEALEELASVHELDNKLEEAEATRREALAMLDESSSDHLVLLSSLLISLAHREYATDRTAEALARFENATKIVRKRSGNNSLELAVLLLNYGQYKANENVEAGLGMIGEARDILERNKDRRAALAGIAAAVIASHADRHADVIKYGDDALAQLGPSAEPEQVALTKWLVAKAIGETKGDTKRARRLAVEARDAYRKLGAKGAKQAERIDAFLKKLR